MLTFLKGEKAKLLDKNPPSTVFCLSEIDSFGKGPRHFQTTNDE